MDYSLPGLIGIVVGVVAGFVSHRLVLTSIERKAMELQKLHPTPTPVMPESLSTTRRVTLAIFVVLFGALGYWAGRSLWT